MLKGSETLPTKGSYTAGASNPGSDPGWETEVKNGLDDNDNDGELTDDGDQYTREFCPDSPTNDQTTYGSTIFTDAATGASSAIQTKCRRLVKDKSRLGESESTTSMMAT